MCSDAGKGNDSLFVVEFCCVETAEHGNAGAVVELGTDCRQFDREVGAQGKGIPVDSTTGKI